MPEAATIPAVVAPLLNEQEARDLTDKIARTTENLWQLIGQAFERKAWSALGYGTWESYTETEFGMSRGQAYRLVDQARTVAALEEAAGLEPGGLGSAVSARAAADLKPVLDDVKSEVAEATRGRRREQRPAAVAEVVEGARARRQRSTTAKKAAAPAAPAKPVELSLDALLGALLKHPPVEAKDLSNNRWAKVRSWVKQADAVRNPIDAKATETTSKRAAGASKSSSGKVTSPDACKHPVNRRIAGHCMDCDTPVK